MNNVDQVKINDLLMEREKQFVAINQCEMVIENILGQAYPALQLYDLPSLRPKSKKRAAKKKKQQKVPAIRRLKKDAESAYQVTFQEAGEEKKVYQRDPRVIQALLKADLDECRITQVETVYFDPAGEVVSIAAIYPK